MKTPGWIALAVLAAALVLYVGTRAPHSPPPPLPAEQPAQPIEGRSEPALETTEPVADSPRVPAGRDLVREHGDTLRSEDGAPVAGARLTRIELPPEPSTVAERGPLAIDWTHVERNATRIETDEAGAFVPPPAPEGAYAWWIEHPDFESALVLQREPGASVAAWPELVASPALALRVVDERGLPVEGAQVELYHARSALDSVADDAHRAAALRLLRRVVRSDAEGRARVSFSRFDCVARAVEGEAVSAWTNLGRDAESELRLRGGFGLQVTARGAGVELSAGGAQLEFWTERGERRFLASQAIDSLGPQAWLQLPRPAAETLVARLTGQGLLGQLLERPLPAAGERIEIAFDLVLAKPLSVTVRSEDGEPIADASIRVTWGEETAALRGETTAATDEEGAAFVDAPAEGRVELEIRAKGYRATSGELWLPEESLEVVLERAATVRGRVVFDDEPLAAPFRISYWLVGSKTRSTSDWMQSEDGAFELAEVPVGELNLLAFAADHPQADPAIVAVPPEGLEAVELSIPAPIRARGQVVDLLTGAPLEGAEIQLCTAKGSDLIALVGLAATTDSDGRFEMANVNPSVLGFGVRRAGYGDLWLTRRDLAGPVADVGLVALPPERDLHVRLEHDGSVDPTQWVTWLVYGSATNAIPFRPAGDGAGEAWIRGVSMGNAVVHVRGPDGTERNQFVVLGGLAPEDPWQVVFRLQGEPFRVRVRSDEPLDTSALSVFATFPAGPVHRTTVEGTWASDGAEHEARFASLPASGEAGISIWSTAGIVATRRFDLATTREPVLAIDLDPLVIEVLDGHGNPLSDVDVIVTAPGADHAWQPYGATDADGRLTLGIADTPTVLVHVLDRTEGSKHGLAVDLASGRRFVRIELDDLADLELRLVDGAAPLPGLRTLLRHPSHTMVVNTDASSAEGLLRFPKLAPDRYVVSLRHPTVWPVEEPLDHTASGSPVEVQVRRLADLELTVRRGDGQPLANTALVLTHEEFQTSVAVWLADGRVAGPSSLATDAQGRLALRGLPRGPYRVACPTLGAAALPLELDPGPNAKTIAYP